MKVSELAHKENRSQSGLDLEGLATTMPLAAPATLEPVEPMLASTPAKAIGLSVAMNWSRVALFSRFFVGVDAAGVLRNPDATAAATNNGLKNMVLALVRLTKDSEE